MKRRTALALALAALSASPPGCRGRDEAASAGDAPGDHSKKSPASSASLPFAPLSFDEALAKARLEKKLVFVDLSADWCSWCGKMDADVFPDARVRRALLDFVAIKVDTDRGGGRAVANRYRVDGLPAYLVVNGDGALIGRFDGYLPAEAFLLQLGRAARSPG